MTKAEEKMWLELRSLMSSIQEENKKFRAEISTKVEVVEKKLETRDRPANMEQEVITAIQNSLVAAMQTVLTGYNSPLAKLAQSILDKHYDEFHQILDASMNEAIKNFDTEKELTQVVSHKIAKVLISTQAGIFDKVSNELKANPEFKAKATLAISGVVTDIMKSKTNL